jgi:AraC-like DNA-binding protein
MTANFASAAMVRVLVRGMASLGLRSPTLDGHLNQAKISLDMKRAIVMSAVEQGGLVCLPLLGRGLHDLAMEPTHLALTAGKSAESMFVRWQRLERYIHSQHRIQIHQLEERSAVIEHIHKDEGAKPLAVEDLVVCGVLCALLEANGLKSVKALADGVELFPCPVPKNLSDCVQIKQTGKWAFSWDIPKVADCKLLLPAYWAHVSPKLWSPFACSVGDLVAQRLPELLPTGEAASSMNLSLRSFQRALAEEGLSYQQLQAEVRFRLAGWHLLKRVVPIAEVGFVCGYSDQAHLTREFNKRVGVAPAKYRDLFAPN